MELFNILHRTAARLHSDNPQINALLQRGPTSASELLLLAQYVYAAAVDCDTRTEAAQQKYWAARQEAQEARRDYKDARMAIISANPGGLWNPRAASEDVKDAHLHKETQALRDTMEQLEDTEADLLHAVESLQRLNLTLQQLAALLTLYSKGWEQYTQEWAAQQTAATV